jgi:hypothetical protein
LRGIPVVLPEDSQDDIEYNDIVKRNWSAMLKASRPLGADAILYGTLEFDGNISWNSQWVMAGGKAYAKWKLTGTTFDKALKDAIDRVMTAYARQAKNFKRSKK